MSLKTLLSLVVALAVLLAPNVIAASAASASVPDHAMQMMASGHCKSMPSSDQEKAPAKNCCVAISMAIAAAAATCLSESFVHQTPTGFAIRTVHLSYLSDIATPPPKQA